MDREMREMILHQFAQSIFCAKDQYYNTKKVPDSLFAQVIGRKDGEIFKLYISIHSAN